MRILSVFVMVLLLSASFCAKNDSSRKPKKETVEIEKDKAKYVANNVTVTKNDTVVFTAKKVKTISTIIIPEADSLFQINGDDVTFKTNGVTYLFISLVEEDENKKPAEWTSREYIIIGNKAIYEYSIFIPNEKKMAEAESSPKIIVDP